MADGEEGLCRPGLQECNGKADLPARTTATSCLVPSYLRQPWAWSGGVCGDGDFRSMASAHSMSVAADLPPSA